MPVGTPIPAETKAAIIRDYVAGEKLVVIAMTHGTHPRYVSILAQAAGHAPRPAGGGPRIKPEVVRAVVDAYANGEALASITERLMVSADTVTRLVKMAGVPMRRKRAQR